MQDVLRLFVLRPMCAQVAEGLSRPHPEFPKNEALTLYRCWDASLVEEEDSFEQNWEMHLTGELDKEGAAILSKDDFASFRVNVDDFGPDGGGNSSALQPKKPKTTPKTNTAPAKTEEDAAMQKLKGRVRQLNDWVMEASGWPQLLKDSPAGVDTVNSFTERFDKWAQTFRTYVSEGQQLATNKGSVHEVTSFLEKTMVDREIYTEFLNVAKRLCKPMAKPKAKVQAKKRGAPAQA